MADEPAAASSSIDDTLQRQGVDAKTGLTADEVQRRLQKYGPNALEEHRQSALAAFLAYFWGPIPWMIEAAALMALIVGDWGDFTIIVSLLLFNAVLGFWEEHAGPNSTTFTLAPELFPTQLRASASGFAAGVAKLGATSGVFVLPIIKDHFGVPTVLALMAGVSLLGLFVTAVAGHKIEEHVPLEKHQQVPVAASPPPQQ